MESGALRALDCRGIGLYRSTNCRKPSGGSDKELGSILDSIQSSSDVCIRVKIRGLSLKCGLCRKRSNDSWSYSDKEEDDEEVGKVEKMMEYPMRNDPVAKIICKYRGII